MATFHAFSVFLQVWSADGIISARFLLHAAVSASYSSLQILGGGLHKSSCCAVCLAFITDPCVI